MLCCGCDFPRFLGYTLYAATAVYWRVPSFEQTRLGVPNTWARWVRRHQLLEPIALLQRGTARGDWANRKASWVHPSHSTPFPPQIVGVQKSSQLWGHSSSSAKRLCGGAGRAWTKHEGLRSFSFGGGASGHHVVFRAADREAAPVPSGAFEFATIFIVCKGTIGSFPRLFENFPFLYFRWWLSMLTSFRKNLWDRIIQFKVKTRLYQRHCFHGG